MSAVLPEFIAFAHTLADAAGDILRPLFRQRVEVEAKGDSSPVTLADREAERCMREAILARYPDHGVWGEEWGRHLPDAKYCWTLDPIDGTKSFISGFPTFNTLISLTRLGVPVLGLIDQPVTHERWLGVSGMPSTFTSNVGVILQRHSGVSRNPEPTGRDPGQPLNQPLNKIGLDDVELRSTPMRTRACASLADATLSTTSPYLFDDAGKHLFSKLKDTARFTVYGYDSYAYAQLACGHIDLVMESGLKPHDFCALRTVIEGAGGTITDWQGKPLTLASDGNVIAAGDKRVHAQVLGILEDSKKENSALYMERGN
jgi:inositol-phosphate phosphatase/L-galactose 1-phosphate phosphatase/histidinol-phosphatase